MSFVDYMFSHELCAAEMKPTKIRAPHASIFCALGSLERLAQLSDKIYIVQHVPPIPSTNHNLHTYQL